MLTFLNLFLKHRMFCTVLLRKEIHFCGINATLTNRQNGTDSKYIFELKRFHPHTLLVCLHAHTLLVCNLFLNLYHLNKYSFHFLFPNCFQLLQYWVLSVPSLNQSSAYCIFYSSAYFFLFHTLLMTQCTQAVITLRTMFMLVDKCAYNFIRTRASVTFFSDYVLCIYVHFFCV